MSTDPPRGHPGPVVIADQAQLAILLHLLDDLATVLRLAAEAPPRPGAAGSAAVTAGLAEQVRDIRVGLRDPADDAPGMAYGANEWRSELCAALDMVPLHAAHARLLAREMQRPPT